MANLFQEVGLNKIDFEVGQVTFPSHLSDGEVVRQAPHHSSSQNEHLPLKQTKYVQYALTQKLDFCSQADKELYILFETNWFTDKADITVFKNSLSQFISHTIAQMTSF